MAIVKFFDKRVGITYVYESESYYDSEKHQSRSHRKLIGRIDPETGEIVPTGKKGRPPKNPPIEDPNETNYRELYEKTAEKLDRRDKKITSLENELAESRRMLAEIQDRLKKIAAICSM